MSDRPNYLAAVPDRDSWLFEALVFCEDVFEATEILESIAEQASDLQSATTMRQMIRYLVARLGVIDHELEHVQLATMGGDVTAEIAGVGQIKREHGTTRNWKDEALAALVADVIETVADEDDTGRPSPAALAQTLIKAAAVTPRVGACRELGVNVWDYGVEPVAGRERVSMPRIDLGSSPQRQEKTTT